MQAAPSPISGRLPGWSAVWMSMSVGLFCGAYSLLFLGAPVLGAFTSPLGQGWHLPSPVLQWLLITPAGNLIQVILSLLVSGSAFVLLARWVVRHEVAHVPDVTELPVAAWPSPGRGWYWSTLRQGWLGISPRQRLVSLALLVLGILLAIALVGVVCGLFVVLVRGPDVHGLCTDQGECPPVVLPNQLPFAASTLPLALLFMAHAFWLRRVERTAGVRFRYASAQKLRPLVYVRQPGVMPEAATVALGAASSARAVPFGRQIFFGVLLAILVLLPWCATCILLIWLPSQWLPR
jgi:hypothetical protein